MAPPRQRSLGHRLVVVIDKGFVERFRSVSLGTCATIEGFTFVEI